MVPEKGWLEWLWPQERRGSTRKSSVPLAAHYWDGDTPAPRGVRDISSDGMYMLTEQRWYPNTLVSVTLTRNDRPEDDPARSIRVTAKVVRSGRDGVGFLEAEEASVSVAERILTQVVGLVEELIQVAGEPGQRLAVVTDVLEHELGCGRLSVIGIG